MKTWKTYQGNKEDSPEFTNLVAGFFLFLAASKILLLHTACVQWTMHNACVLHILSCQQRDIGVGLSLDLQLSSKASV